ncbi:MAG: hypothetical protein ABR866_00310 [Candidatus Korobacteraceae bacterium]|jgi:hypothetical protein
MATFFVLRLIAALIMLAFAFLLQFLGELFENKPWRRAVKVLRASCETDPSPVTR